MKYANIILCSAAILISACAGGAKSKPQEQQAEDQDMTIALTKAEFLKKIVDYEDNPLTWEYLGDKPAIVDFYADWCPPCKQIAPMMDQIASEYADEIYVYRIDVEKEKELIDTFGIRGLPMVLFIPMEGQPLVFHNCMPKPVFDNAVETILLDEQPIESAR